MLECEVVVEDSPLRENLCQCLRILGETPEVSGSLVSVSCKSKKRRQVVELFRQFTGAKITFVD